jgi:serine/threonine protein phosphatase PrpC
VAILQRKRLMKNTDLFSYRFLSAVNVDIGARRSTNQDKVICCPDFGFFAVSDGMGGLPGGGETSAIIAKTLPLFIVSAYKKLKEEPTPQRAADLLAEQVRLLSDTIYTTMNPSGQINYGATLCGVWLVSSHAVFVNLGDSRGYLLENNLKHLRQVTVDHNVAAKLKEMGLLSPQEARDHPSSSSLTRFMGMDFSAKPDIFIEKLQVNDRILLCSDGLYGMIEDRRLYKWLLSSQRPQNIVKRLTKKANQAGGLDNISVAYIQLVE